MTTPATNALRHLLGWLRADPGADGCSDPELLRRFLVERNEGTFDAILRRHGPMVYDVCRGVLGDAADAEDAFQATFLVLAKKAGSIRHTAALGSWLHGVARRVALKLQAGAARRRHHEARAARPERPPADALNWGDVRRILHEELAVLPERHRGPLLLCYLQGKTQDEAAALLGLSKGTLKRRLERGRARLRERLARRGLGAPAVLLASAWPAAGVREGLLAATARAAANASSGLAPARVAALADGVANDLLLGKLKGLAAGLAVAAMLAAGLAGLLRPTPVQPVEPRPAQGDGKAATAGGRAPKERVVLRGHTNSIWSVALTPDGRTLVSASFDKTVRVWDVRTGRERVTLRGHTRAVEFVVVTPDGKLAASADQGGAVKVWDLSAGRARLTIANPESRPASLFLTADGRTLTAGWVFHVKQWDLSTGRQVASFKYPDLSERTAVRSDGKLIARHLHAVNPDTVMLFDLPSGQLRASWQQNAEATVPVTFSPDGRTLFLLRGRRDAVQLQEVATGRVRAIMSHISQRHIGHVAVHPHGRLLALPREDRKAIRLVDLATGKDCADLPVDNDNILSIAFSGDGNTLAASEGPDSAIRVWDLSGFWKARPPVKEKLSAGDLEALWADLAGADVGQAYRAMWTLATAPKQAALWIGRRLSPVVAADEKVTARLLADLNADRSEVRDRAVRRLDELGESAWPALEKAMQANPPAEVRRRVRGLLEKLERHDDSPERLRLLRAVEALEYADTAEARAVLDRLAGGVTPAVRTREARAALERIARREKGAAR